MKTEEFYASIMQCTNCSSPNVVRDNHTHLPQGFFTLAQPGDRIKVMAVAQNPGVLVPGGQLTATQLNRYKGLSPESAAKEHLKFVKQCFLGGAGTVFHSRLLDWLADLLSVPSADVFRQVVYTNLVKCATSANKPPSKKVCSDCHTLHFQREIKLWNPEVIVGLGGWTCMQLSLLGVPHLELPHPRHREHADYHRPYIDKIRMRLKG